jgi:tetratricopeptide (TPR) repeat protein
VLGSGGVGKSALSRFILHDVEIMKKFGSRRYFIRCDAAASYQDLLTSMATTFNLSDQLIYEQIIDFLDDPDTKTLLIFDNFETPWEPSENRLEIEEFLSVLSAIKSLSLMFTLRGVERPLGVAWTKPVFRPLKPLRLPASRQTFIAISNVSELDPCLDQLLEAVGHLPLAITLLANLAQVESPEVLLQRWKSEKTSLLTRGAHRLSNLEVSIKVSLDSPRMKENPDAEALLRLISLLPDGVAEGKLPYIAPTIRQPARAAAALRTVALANTDRVGTLRILTPIRAFILEHYPPDSIAVSALHSYYMCLAEQGGKAGIGTGGRAVIDLLTPEVGNLQAVIEDALEREVNLEAAIEASIRVSPLFIMTGLGSTRLLSLSAAAAAKLSNPELQADCVRCQGEIYYSRSMKSLAAACFEEARSLYQSQGLFAKQGKCMVMLGLISSLEGDHSMAVAKFEEGKVLYTLDGDSPGVAECLYRLGQAAAWKHEYSKAETLIEQALSIPQDARAQARCLWLWGVILFEHRADYELSIAKLSESSTLHVEAGDVAGEANCIRTLGRIAVAQSRYSDATRHFGDAIKLYQKVHWVLGEAFCLQDLAGISLDLHDPDAAAQKYGQALCLFETVEHNNGLIECIKGLGDVAFQSLDYFGATIRYEQALALCHRHDNFVESARISLALADVSLQLSNMTSAEEHIETASAMFRRVESIGEAGEASILMKRGDTFYATGRPDAAAYYKAALPTYRKLGKLRGEGQCLMRLGDIAIRRGKQEKAIRFFEDALSCYKRASDRVGEGYCIERLTYIRGMEC